MSAPGRVRAVGVNHVALDLGDQFVALSAPRRHPPDDDRHFGLVVDDRERLRAALRQAGVEVPEAGPLRFRDPWGNNIEVVDYREVQFTKAPEVLRGMGLEGLVKTDSALAELRAKGLTG